jgi:peptide/nickel transport system permease protein
MAEGGGGRSSTAVGRGSVLLPGTEGPPATWEPKVGRTVGPEAGQRGGVVLSVVLPGLPQLLAGRLLAGGLGLLFWGGSIGLLVVRWDRILAAPAGPWDHRVALLTLIGLLAGSWLWSLRDVRRRQALDGVPGQGGRWVRELRAFHRNRLAIAGGVGVILLYLIALLTPLLAPFDPALQGSLATHRLVGPSPEHLLGTDQFARDILSRLLYGARISLSIGLVAVSIALAIGTVLGAVAGFLGGWVDTIAMRVVDMVLAFPRLVLLIAVIALFQPSLGVIVVVLGLTQWPQMARIVRGEVLSLREREFIEAGRVLGLSRMRIVRRHVLPNILAPVFVVAALGIGDTIILEAILSFLGLGVQPPTASWGGMVADGRSHLLGAWWITTFPGLAIVLTVLAFNLLGDGLRDALDPRLRR